MKYLIVYASYFIFTFISCFKEDTCNEKLGDTFETVMLSSSGFNDENNFQIELALQTLEVLPPTYYSDAKLLTHKIYHTRKNPQPNSSGKISTFQMTHEELQLILHRDSLPAVGDSASLFFFWELSDRRDYIDCMHPGSDDRYYLDLSMNLIRVLEDSLTIYNFDWNETLSLGGF